MKIIYLDQYLVSDLADKVTETHSEISKLLINLQEKGKICCPLSGEHYLESSKRNLEDAKKNDAFLNKVSGGLCFHPNFNITVESIQRYIRKKPINHSTYLGEGIPNLFQKDTFIVETQKRTDEYSKIINSSQKESNTLKKILNSNNKFKLNSNSESFKAIKRIDSNEFVNRMNECFKQGYFKIRGDKTAIGEIPNWIDVICEYLMRHYKFDEGEMVKLMIEFKEFGFDNIPTLNIVSSLRAFQSIKHKLIQPNDEIDNIRICGSLPVSDIMFTDKKRKSEIKEMKLDKKYKCKVLCGTEKDLSEFKKLLINCR